MERNNYAKVPWNKCTLFSRQVLYTEHRIDRRDIPEFPYVYEVRMEEDEEESCTYISEIDISVPDDNEFGGTILSTIPFPVNMRYHSVYINKDNCYIEFLPYSDFNTLARWVKDDDSAFIVPANQIIHKVTKLFISQPFTGYDEKQIKKQRKLLRELYAIYTERPVDSIELINQLDPIDYKEEEFKAISEDRWAQYTFCRSIGLLGSADVVLFYGDWTKSRGCKIEHKICKEYHIPSIGQNDLIQFCMDNPKYDDDYFMPLWKKQFFDMHDIADVNIFRNNKDGGFNATAEIDCNKYCGSGDTPNDAYIDLYSKLDEVAHDIVTKQIDSLKNSNVTVAICDDAETVTDEELINMHKDYISACDNSEPASESEIELPDISAFHILDPCGLLDKDTERYPLFIHDEHNSHPLIINHEVLSKFMYDIKKPMKVEVSFGFGDMSGGYGVFKPDELYVHVAATTLTCTKKVKNDATSIIEIRSKDINQLRYAKVTIWAK